MKAVFLDRDGVINKYPGDRKYVTSLKRFRFLSRVKAAVVSLNKSGFRVFVVSNQAGVSKGVYTQATLDSITSHMLSSVEQAGGKIDAVYYCTHRSEDNCSCRKPKAGLLFAAKKDYPAINFKDSFFIGDTMRDMQAAGAVKCKSILVLSGKEKMSNSNNWDTKPDFVFKNFWEAARFITRKK